MGVDDMVYFAKTLFACDVSDIGMLTLPSQVYDKYMVMNRAATLEVINKHFNTFDKKITDGIFDSGNMFCDVSDGDMISMYNASPDKLYDGNVYFSDSMEDEIRIPMDKEYLEEINKSKAE